MAFNLKKVNGTDLESNTKKWSIDSATNDVFVQIVNGFDIDANEDYCVISAKYDNDILSEPSEDNATMYQFYAIKPSNGNVTNLQAKNENFNVFLSFRINKRAVKDRFLQV